MTASLISERNNQNNDTYFQIIKIMGLYFIVCIAIRKWVLPKGPPLLNLTPRLMLDGNRFLIT